MIQRRTRLARCAALVAALAGAGLALAQTAAPPAAPASRAAASHPVVAQRAAKAVAPRPGPLWRDLTPVQQKALAPLSGQWDTLNEAQKRKWIAMSSNYQRMSGEEQAKLNSRMTEWVALSPQQRSIARLNYGETQKLSPDDKKAKWEAYQALSPEEKKKLAATASSPKPPSTAAAVKPIPREKLAVLPKARNSGEAKAPRIAAAPEAPSHGTAAPQPAVQPHAVQPHAVTPAQAPVAAPPPSAHPAPQQAGTPD